MAVRLNWCARITSLLLVFYANLAFSYPLAPDPDLTQGELCTESDSDFSEYRYEENIPYCSRNVSWYRREQIYNQYNIPINCRHRYTIDHFLPLSIGGNNADSNLWPEHKLVKATRPTLEQDVFWALNRGDLTQEEAIEIILKEKAEAISRVQKNYFITGDPCDMPSQNLSFQ